MTGQTVSHYRILEKLGGGGMGVVYKAEDTKLGRTVALKVLPPERVADPNRKRRFIQEARAASALNHPNIVTIHDIDEAEGVHFIAMEYVAGKTLDRLIARHGLRLNEALKYAVQMAAGLAKAHSAGIVHRDLKPTNVMVTDDGLVKVLDFGLAKLTEAAPTSDAETVATVGPATEEGTIVGTVGYMSPEQAEGKPVDARSDIFSFGSVLYEMLTGQRAFQGETKASTIAAILREEPKPLSQIVEGLPKELERLVKRCLRKDREHRFQTMADLKVALEELKEESDSGELAEAVGAGMARPWEARALPCKWAALAAIVVLAGTAFLAYWLARPLPAPRVSGSTQLTHDGHQKSGVRGFQCVLVTDGARLFFNEYVPDHYVLAQVSVGGGDAVPISTPFQNTRAADISPDRTELLLGSFGAMEPEYPLWTFPTLGGSPRRLGQMLCHDAAWAPNGRAILCPQGQDLYVVGSDGSQPRKLATLPGTPSVPCWSPDGKKIRFTLNDPKTNSNSLWEVDADGSRLHALLPGWNTPPDECCGRWTSDGRYYVFSSTRGGISNIWALRETSGLFHRGSFAPVQLTTGTMGLDSPLPGLDGKKLFVVGTQRRGELVRYDAKAGQWVPCLSGISAQCVSPSKDGKRVAYVTYPEGNLWVSDSDGSGRVQLTFPPLYAFLPYWSPDGKEIAFMALTSDHHWHIFLLSAEGGSPEQLTLGERDQDDPSWSTDGISLAYSESPTPLSQGGPIHLMNLQTHQISNVPNSEGIWAPRWSPNGQYIVAESPNGDKLMLFDFTAQKWEVVAQLTANYMTWASDSETLYFDTIFEKDPAFYRLRIRDRKLERLVSLKGIRRVGEPLGGGWSGLSPDGSPLVLRDIGTQDIYALDVDFP
jgi:Tol biopolymer transport system component/predicted Ser/Thr protein kinase